jgi:hypothetical protein
MGDRKTQDLDFGREMTTEPAPLGVGRLGVGQRLTFEFPISVGWGQTDALKTHLSVRDCFATLVDDGSADGQTMDQSEAVFGGQMPGQIASGSGPTHEPGNISIRDDPDQ